jgi:hypothetical protein
VGVASGMSFDLTFRAGRSRMRASCLERVTAGSQ